MDPFDILGVPCDASEDEINAAFKRLALEHHPDRNPGDPDAPARFRCVKGAYDAIRTRRTEEAKPQRARRRSAVRDAHPAEQVDRVARASENLRRAHRGEIVPQRAADVIDRLRSLLGAMDRASNAPIGVKAIDAVLDEARWSRLYVDLALAFQRQVYPLRDDAWCTARYTGEREAWKLLASFRETVVRLEAMQLDVVELRNLRARLDGLIAVLEGFQRASAPGSA
jgi:curved DNA-binding protein CbpA